MTPKRGLRGRAEAPDLGARVLRDAGEPDLDVDREHAVGADDDRVAVELAHLGQLVAERFRELYEAISIEGANVWQRFRHVTLPLITPVIFFTIVMGVIDGFQYFDQAFVAGNVASGQTAVLGSPQNALLFYSIYLYQWAFRNFDMGYAAAMAWVLFLTTLAVTVLFFAFQRRLVFYAGED